MRNCNMFIALAIIQLTVFLGFWSSLKFPKLIALDCEELAKHKGHWQLSLNQTRGKASVPETSSFQRMTKRLVASSKLKELTDRTGLWIFEANRIPFRLTEVWEKGNEARRAKSLTAITLKRKVIIHRINFRKLKSLQLTKSINAIHSGTMNK